MAEPGVDPKTDWRFWEARLSLMTECVEDLRDTTEIRLSEILLDEVERLLFLSLSEPDPDPGLTKPSSPLCSESSSLANVLFGDMPLGWRKS